MQRGGQGLMCCLTKASAGPEHHQSALDIPPIFRSEKFPIIAHSVESMYSSDFGVHQLTLTACPWRGRAVSSPRHTEPGVLSTSRHRGGQCSSSSSWTHRPHLIPFSANNNSEAARGSAYIFHSHAPSHIRASSLIPYQPSPAAPTSLGPRETAQLVKDHLPNQTHNTIPRGSP
jgi:hypothetical protein